MGNMDRRDFLRTTAVAGSIGIPEFNLFDIDTDELPIEDREEFVEYWKRKAKAYVPKEEEEELVQELNEDMVRSEESIRGQIRRNRTRVSEKAERFARELELQFEKEGTSLYPITTDHELIEGQE
jgi:hypothetical protein